MAVTFYSSDDAGAPQTSYSGSSGNYQTNITEILDAILVNGYGSKPGMGWTKEMTSDVEGSDRTVYKNQSAYESDCFLIVQSNKESNGGVRALIADSVTSPEVYSGYSQVALFYSSGNKWMAVGDERTLILIFYPTNQYTVTSSSFNFTYPLTLYFGDLDRQNNTTHKGHGILCPYLYSGNLDSSFGNTGASRGTLYISGNTWPQKDKVIRPVTQVPGEEWSTNDCYAFTGTFLERADTNLVSEENNEIGHAETIAAFEQRAQLRVPWFLIISMKYVYRLRGVFNIYPWLMHNDVDNKANMLKPLTVDGIEYRATKQNNSRNNNYPMTVYIQTSGEW